MFEVINLLAMIVTISLGLFGWLAPRYTLSKVGLKNDDRDGSRMGFTEIRAANGALFVFAGAGALWLAHPFTYAAIGFMYLGAAIGRITGIVVDKASSAKAWSFFAFELVLASALLGINLQ